MAIRLRAVGLHGDDDAVRDLGIAAVICLHRGQAGQARHHLGAAAPQARLIGHCVIGPLALARSLDREQAGRYPKHWPC